MITEKCRERWSSRRRDRKEKIRDESFKWKGDSEIRKGRYQDDRRYL